MYYLALNDVINKLELLTKINLKNEKEEKFRNVNVTFLDLCNLTF